MPVIRTYHCGDCNVEFEVTCNSGDGDPDCPNCARVLDWRPGMFNTRSNVSRAVDVTQKIMEQYGHTNFKDNTREGETVVMAPAEPQTAKRDEIVQQVSEFAQHRGTQLNPLQAQMASGFWGGVPAGAMPTVSAAELLSSAKSATAQADAQGVHPMKVLHGLGKKGQLPLKLDIVARAKM